MGIATEPRLVVLRERLQAERADGAAFGPAWKAARAEVLLGLTGAERNAWMSVLANTRWAWRSAYYGGRSSSRADCMAELEGFAADTEVKPLHYEPAA